jgi:putative oxidoreductase
MKGKGVIWTEQVTLNLLRISGGFLFFQHGLQKLFGILGGNQVADFFGMMGLAGLLETVGGALLLLGLFSRPVAFVLSGEMAWAYFMQHAPAGLWPIMNGGEQAALYSFLFLYLAARGGGAFSLDGVKALRKGATPKEVPSTVADKTPDQIPELTEEDLAEDPEIAELLGDT